MAVAGLSSQRTIFEASSWFHFMIGAAYLKNLIYNLKALLWQILVILFFLLGIQLVCTINYSYQEEFKAEGPTHSRPCNTIVGVSSLYLLRVLVGPIPFFFFFHFSAKKMSRGFSDSIVLIQNSSGVK